MEARTIKRAFVGLLAAAGVLLTLVAMFLLSITAQNSDDFDRLHNVLITVNIAGAILLFVLLIGNLIRLLRDYRVRLRALLATEQYSAPLRLLFFWRDEWQLKSEWYEWKLER